VFNFLRFGKSKANPGRLPTRDEAPQATAVTPLRIACSGESYFVSLISGSGIGDTGGGLCLFDGSSLQTIDRVTTAGMAVGDGRLARILSTPLSTGTGEILIYDGRGVTHYLRVDELSDAHYLVWDKEHLVISSTGNNSIVWITPAGEIVRRWRMPGEDDSWHLNGIYLHDGQLYSCAFGKYPHYRGYKDRLSQGDGFVFELESGRTVAQGLCAPHSPVRVDGLWTVCDSLRNAVVQFDASTGRKVRQVELRAFTRGLAVTDDYLIVGESIQRRETSKDIAGSFAVLRRSDLSLVARFPVPFREVSDIVVVPHSLAHAAKTGFRTNPLRVSETDQLQMFRDVGIEPTRLWAVSERLNASQCSIRVQADIPPHFVAGKLTLVDCTVTNVGEGFLCSELPYPVYISYKWKRTKRSPEFPHLEGIRTRLPKVLAPRESIHCRIEVQAPEVEGEVKLTITVLQELVVWFDELDKLNGFSAVVKIGKLATPHQQDSNISSAVGEKVSFPSPDSVR
jgi:acetolactate synthase-1/2/3 large subunit